MARPEGEEDLSGDSTQRDLRGQVGWPVGADGATQAWRDLTGHEAPVLGPVPAPLGGVVEETDKA